MHLHPHAPDRDPGVLLSFARRLRRKRKMQKGAGADFDVSFFFQRADCFFFRFSYPMGSVDHRTRRERATRAVPLGRSLCDPTASQERKCNIVGTRGELVEHSRLEGVALESRKICRHIDVPPPPLWSTSGEKQATSEAQNTLGVECAICSISLSTCCPLRLYLNRELLSWRRGGKWRKGCFPLEKLSIRSIVQSRRRLAPFARFSFSRSLAHQEKNLSTFFENTTHTHTLSQEQG